MTAEDERLMVLLLRALADEIEWAQSLESKIAALKYETRSATPGGWPWEGDRFDEERYEEVTSSDCS